MQAFVSNWTRPYAVRCPGRPYQMTDFDLLTTVLSALVWRRENGSIRMITDDTGAQYYRSLGLTDLWDGGIFTYLNDIPSAIDPCTFWAAGKLYALAATPAPCVMLDTDFIVWHSLSEHWHRPARRDSSGGVKSCHLPRTFCICVGSLLSFSYKLELARTGVQYSTYLFWK